MKNIYFPASVKSFIIIFTVPYLIINRALYITFIVISLLHM